MFIIYSVLVLVSFLLSTLCICFCAFVFPLCCCDNCICVHGIKNIDLIQRWEIFDKKSTRFSTAGHNCNSCCSQSCENRPLMSAVHLPTQPEYEPAAGSAQPLM